MAAGEVHVGNVGTVFRDAIQDENSQAVDLSSATLIQYIFEKPDGTLLNVNGVFTTNGADGQVQYTTQSGDLDQNGQWRYQIKIVIGANTFFTDITKFKVFQNLPI